MRSAPRRPGKLASVAVLVVQPAGPAAASSPCRSARTPAAASAPSGCRSPRRSPSRARRRCSGARGRAAAGDRRRRRSSTPRGAAALLAPVGDLEVDLPDDVTDAAGEVVADAGAATIDAAQAAAVLAARDPTVPAAEQYPAADAVWSAVATAVGDGVAPTPAQRRRRPHRRPPAAGRRLRRAVRPHPRWPCRRPGAAHAAGGRRQNPVASTSACSTRPSWRWCSARSPPARWPPRAPACRSAW